MSYLRELDRDVQVRRLRQLLPGSPPSSWRVAELLDYADAAGATRSSDTTLLAQTARANALAGRDDVAIACCERGLPRDPAKFHAIAANFVHHRRGDLTSARDSARAGLAVTWHRSVDKADLLLALARAEMRLGELTEATRAYDTCIVQNVRALLPVAYLGLSWVAQLRKDFAEARRHNGVARRLFQEDGDDVGLLSADSDSAVLEYAAGRPDVAEPFYRRAIDRRRCRIDTQMLTTDLSNYAVLFRATGRPRQAIELLSEAVLYAEHQSRPRAAAGVLINLGNCLQEVGNPNAALAAYARAARLSRGIPADDYEFRALVSLLDGLASGGASALPASVVERCQRIRATAGRSLSATTETAFEGLLADVPVLSQEPASVDETALNATLRQSTVLDVEQAIREVVGTGPSSKSRIDPRRIVDFLWHYAGDPFRNRDYRSELFVDRAAARSHLRWLTNRRIVEQDGARRGAVYRLAISPR